jgi:hypothetical protein
MSITSVPTVDEIRAKACAAAFGGPLVSNIYRGLVAEIIVGMALGSEWRLRSGEWSGWDFEHPTGLRLEVKQSDGSANLDRDEKGYDADIRHSDANRIFRGCRLDRRPATLRRYLCLRASPAHGRERRSPQPGSMAI